MHVSEALESRLSSSHFDATHVMSDDEIRDLVALATHAPSSFNIQHWRFVAVREPDGKKALQAAAFNQQKVGDAAVTFVVLGDLRAHEDFAVRTTAAAVAGHFDKGTAAYLVNLANMLYSNPAMARDEAVRSGGLVAMALMLAAEERGLASGPMIGFDPAAVSKLLEIDERYVPVMLVVVGRAASGNGPRKPRLPVDQVLRFETGSF